MATTKYLTHAGIMTAGMLFFLEQPLYAADAQTAADPTVSSLPAIPPVESNLTVKAVGSETGSFESNPLMLTQGAKSLWGSTTSPELIVNDSTPMTQLNVDTLVNENVFNQSSFDSTDVHSGINLTTQNQRWLAGVQEKTDYDTTRTSELATYDLSATPVRHLGLSVAPEVSYAPSATDKLTLLGSAASSQYGSSTYSNYEVFSVTPTYAHDFDPRNTGIFQIQGQTYKTTNNVANTVDTLGPSIGWITTLTPKLTAKATVGAQTSRQYTEGVTSEPWRVDGIYSVDIGFKGQQDATDLISSRAEYPSGNGTESLLTGVSVTESHVLNPRFSLNIAASYQSGQYMESTTGSLQTLWSANAGLTYHVTDHIDATAAYQYRYETLTSTSGEAVDNIFTLGIVYRPKAWAL